MASRAEKVVLPAISAQLPASAIQSGWSRRIRPSRPMITRAGSCSSRHQVTSVRSPKVQHITMPEPLSGSASRVAEHRQLHPEHGAGDGAPEQVGVALVVGMGDQGHAGGDQLRPGGLDARPDRRVRVEGHPVVGAGIVPGLELGLGHRGLEGHVPHRRRLGQVGLAALQVAQERLLGHGDRVVGDRGVEAVPVHAQPHPAPQVLERASRRCGSARGTARRSCAG